MSHSLVVVSEGIEKRFIINPETRYVLMPAEDYGKYSGDELQNIKNYEEVSGIFNHKNLKDLNNTFS